MSVPRRVFLGGAAALVVAGCAAAKKKLGTVPPGAAASGPTATTPAPVAAPTTGVTAAPTGAPATFVAHGPSTATGVALTFHTAGDPTITQSLLDQAAQTGAKLTFFVVGTWLAANPGMAKKILDGGHEIGNHTWSHIDLPALGPAAMYEEIDHCARVIAAQTGSIGKWFRPSQTDVPSAGILAQAGKVGYATSVGYDVDPLDYTNPGSALVLSRTRARIQPGSIVSLHTLYQGTADAFGGIVAAIHAKGLQPVTVSSLLGG